jgi:hypothetical protein
MESKHTRLVNICAVVAPMLVCHTSLYSTRTHRHFQRSRARSNWPWKSADTSPPNKGQLKHYTHGAATRYGCLGPQPLHIEEPLRTKRASYGPACAVESHYFTIHGLQLSEGHKCDVNGGLDQIFPGHSLTHRSGSIYKTPIAPYIT